MPVIDLQSYLGLPQAPPANPVFQRTRQLTAGSPYENALALVQQADQVRGGRASAALQAMQNQYNTIAQQAASLRMQQEADMQAEEATAYLAELNPESPDYIAKRSDLSRRFPLAEVHPKVQQIYRVNDSLYDYNARRANERSQAESAWGKEIGEAAALGAPVEELRKIQPGDYPALGAAKSRYGKKTTESDDYRVKGAYNKWLDLLAEDPALATEFENTVKANGIHWGPQAAITTPAQSEPASGKTSVLNPVRAAPSSNTAIEPPDVVTVDEVPKIPTVDPTTLQSERDGGRLLRIAQNANITPELRRGAIEAIKSFKFDVPENLTFGEVESLRSDLQMKADEAFKNIARDEEIIKTVNPAWNRAKDEVVALVASFAKNASVPVSVIYNSLAKGDPKIDGAMVLGQRAALVPVYIKGIKTRLKQIDATESPVTTFFKGATGEYRDPTYADVLKALALERAGGTPSDSVPSTAATPPAAGAAAAQAVIDRMRAEGKIK